MAVDAAAGSSDDTPNTTSASMPCCAIAVGTFRRSAMPCFSASLKSTIQRMPSSMRGLVVRRGSRVVWIRADRGLAIDRCAERVLQPAHRARVATAIQRCGIARASGARCQRAAGRIFLHRGGRELRLDRQRLVGRDRRGRPVADVGRAQRARDPRRALRIEAIAELLPRERARRLRRAPRARSAARNADPREARPATSPARANRRGPDRDTRARAAPESRRRAAGRNASRAAPAAGAAARPMRERRGQLGRQRRRSEREQIAGRRKQSCSHGYLVFRCALVRPWLDPA